STLSYSPLHSSTNPSTHTFPSFKTPKPYTNTSSSSSPNTPLITPSINKNIYFPIPKTSP
ncbi:hypothetical protein, partial [Bacillus pumilus]|uniref:hypothetical protein n=1 Tax=Bacillus pumilus TaxID=1408 RepID=UPI001C92C14C